MFVDVDTMCVYLCVRLCIYMYQGSNVLPAFGELLLGLADSCAEVCLFSRLRICAPQSQTVSRAVNLKRCTVHGDALCAERDQSQDVELTIDQPSRVVRVSCTQDIRV